MVGLECLLLLSAHELVRKVKENVVVTIVMHEEGTPEEVERTKKLLDVAPYCLDYRFVSREEALQEHIVNLGEDPTAFLGYNPLTDAFEIHLQAPYAHADSIEHIEKRLSGLPYIDKVIYQKDVVKVLDNNLNEIALVLLAVALALLVIALVLISNTIQLQVYSKRFLINTMRLVGATPWVIKWPFIGRNIRMGLVASILAILLLAATYYYCQTRLGIVLFPLVLQNMLFITSTVLITGIVITFFASLVATNRYIRMKISKMYEI